MGLVTKSSLVGQNEAKSSADHEPAACSPLDIQGVKAAAHSAKFHVRGPRSEFIKLSPGGAHSGKKIRQKVFRSIQRRKIEWMKDGEEGEEGTKEQEEKCSRRRTKEQDEMHGWRRSRESMPALSQIYGFQEGSLKSHAQMSPWFDDWIWGTSGSWVRTRWEIIVLIPVQLQGLSVHISINIALLKSSGREVFKESQGWRTSWS